MLGFATVDLSEADGTLAIWLTSLVTTRMVPYIDHTNAVGFDLGEDQLGRRAWNMACDRYVVVTGRTPLEHPVFAELDLKPCDLDGLLEQTRVSQEAILTAFAEYKKKPGKKALTEPSLPPVPDHLDEESIYVDQSRKPALVLADHVKAAWNTWLETDRDRVKRRSYMPEGRDSEKLSTLPLEFTEGNSVQPVRVWR